MRVLNRDIILKTAPKVNHNTDYDNMCIHKKHNPSKAPKVSIVLLDWSCRERFNTLDWLLRQDVPKESYELIWIELYDRVVPEVLEKTDTLITCGQKGMYHKHIGYNLGLLNSHGEIIVISDSDAVYPKDFISSIFKSFYPDNSKSPQPLVLVHYQLRTSLLYPDNLKDSDELKDGKWQWWPLNPNAGACMSFRKQDAIRFGGFDEHKSLRGYLCGPYDLGWRLVNAGIPERWHDTSTVLWHFAHPDPVGVNGILPTLKLMYENTFPHVDLHAITAVEALSTGRFQPLKENPEIFKLRMADRSLGTKFEEKYANMTGQDGFSKWQILRLKVFMIFDMVWTVVSKSFCKSMRTLGRSVLGERGLERLRSIKYRYLPMLSRDKNNPVIVASYKQFNLVAYNDLIYGLPQSLRSVDFNDEQQLSNPAIIKDKSCRKLKREINKRINSHEV